jgi:hypothetical protein
LRGHVVFTNEAEARGGEKAEPGIEVRVSQNYDRGDADLSAAVDAGAHER